MRSILEKIFSSIKVEDIINIIEKFFYGFPRPGIAEMPDIWVF